jgi:hypothetical protein
MIANVNDSAWCRFLAGDSEPCLRDAFVTAQAEEAAVEGTAMQCKPPREPMIVKGGLGEWDIEILNNTAQHCPVSRMCGQDVKECWEEFAIQC